ncbi:hypothetical protein QAD02_016148 [Eretmocerus hayati]|uniref:Uncharacterized protein n=1 Tax=Eretmocerus hayati TaxID=131215 RepID=A0ACC2PA77_9HYME|nr:hypothetical protein QAD02_016148 [Eretmocerus hayati]
MGERRYSKIAVMQLFHELKQQFPTLPDHVVSDCIVQSGHDRESCIRGLQAHQDGRGPPGAFPPPPPQPEQPSSWISSIEGERRDFYQPLSIVDSGEKILIPNHKKLSFANAPRALRPHSLDIDNRGTHYGEQRVNNYSNHSDLQRKDQQQRRLTHQPYSAPPAFLDEGCYQHQPRSSRFELNVNVSCSSPVILSSPQDPFYNGSVIRHQHQHSASSSSSSGVEVSTCPSSSGRSCTTVSLTLRSPLSESLRQTPVEVTNSYQQQIGTSSSRAYNNPSTNYHHQQDSGDSASSEPGIYHSRLQISIGRMPCNKNRRPTSLLATVSSPMAAFGNEQRPPGLPVGPSNHPVRPSTSTMMTSATAWSAPNTPSGPAALSFTPSSGGSLPSTPITGPAVPQTTIHNLTTRTSLGAIPRRVTTPRPEAAPRWSQLKPESLALVDQVENQFKPLVMEQLIRKERLVEALEAEKTKLEAMKRDVESLSNLSLGNTSSQDQEMKLKSDIYRLQIECDRLSQEVDSKSDRRVPLGETNAEFYQSIYTGQQYTPQSSNMPPPLPSQPPAWEPRPSRNDIEEDVDGPSWVCQRCTFDNHFLMNKCEQCEEPKSVENVQGGAQDIHIRVTHHHNFSPGCTAHNWIL